jgi:hypothetical protein
MRHKSERNGAEGARRGLGSRLLLAVLALVLVPAFAAAPEKGGAPPRNPELANMQIEIWPEFDRPAALVILRGALAVDAAVPAELTLRIPATSGGPSAMAYSETAGGNLLNLEHQSEKEGEFIKLRFKVPQRFFHVEFYEPVATDKSERSYIYVWPGDMGVKRMNLVVQEPASASNFSVQPKLEAATTGQDGLRYRSADLGAQAAGKSLPIKLSYAKMGARTSAEILGQKAPEPAPAPAAASALTPAPAAGSNDEVTKGVLIFILAISLLIALGSAVLWWRGRAPAQRKGGAGACTQCGTPREAGDRFCSNCGARLK